MVEGECGNVEIELPLLHLYPFSEQRVVLFNLVDKFDDVFTSFFTHDATLAHTQHLASNAVEERHNPMYERHLSPVLGVLAFVVGNAAQRHLQPLLQLLLLFLELFNLAFRPMLKFDIWFPTIVAELAKAIARTAQQTAAEEHNHQERHNEKHDAQQHTTIQRSRLSLEFFCTILQFQVLVGGKQKVEIRIAVVVGSLLHVHCAVDETQLLTDA